MKSFVVIWTMSLHAFTTLFLCQKSCLLIFTPNIHVIWLGVVTPHPPTPRAMLEVGKYAFKAVGAAETLIVIYKVTVYLHVFKID